MVLGGMVEAEEVAMHAIHRQRNGLSFWEVALQQFRHDRKKLLHSANMATTHERQRTEGRKRMQHNFQQQTDA